MKTTAHFGVLDGWRGVSIVLVLAAHLLPIGPKSIHLNVAAGVMGMVLFFSLSGFLITTALLKDSSVKRFLIRRLFRIVPLAWLYLLIVLALVGASRDIWLAHLFFYANLPPIYLVAITDHFWSLCVEVQFYIGIALLFVLFRKRGLFLLPVLCVLITLGRMWNGVYASSVTWFRMDEILAGSGLALMVHDHMGALGSRIVQAMKKIPQWLVFFLLIISCMEQGTFMNYFRPYLAAFVIGATLLNPEKLLGRWLNIRPLFYLGGISYALYIIHIGLSQSWLGSGDNLEKYAKRPLLFFVLFALAHLSTYHYEKRWIALGKKLAGRVGVTRQ